MLSLAGAGACLSAAVSCHSLWKQGLCWAGTHCHIDKLAESYGTKVLAKLPIDPDLAAQCDKGVIELFEGDYLERAADFIEASFK